MTKENLRKQYKEWRMLFSPSEVNHLSASIFANLKNMDIWDHTYYHTFVPIAENNEINTWPLIEHLWSLDKRVSVPKMIGKNTSEQLAIDPETTWERHPFGMEEPKEGWLVMEEAIDVIFVPLLACTSDGHRIGYGGGVYDRLLTKCRPDCLKIGLSLFPPIAGHTISFQDHDVQMDVIVLP